ncbi:MAG: purine/pyrimidine permease [Prevotella sp.]|jgi:xanthine/uracil permease|nr:purine/pyrimidine permease [Prevotella sp.]MCI1780390.1 purine/pyrimidine permease [Prevotella sp.]MCI1801777.1 purine/pyrimidine permease [Prevotella sp.]MCI1815783.1 purine/pyrimidine permease [Prevotella sp.]MCI1847272.1 purine/pyrimidine permease [Prevotella sp.]
MSFHSSSLKYQNDDKPSLFQSILYGLQWFLITIPFIIIIGVVVGGIEKLNPAEVTLYNQKLFAITGIGFLVQIFIGHRLPLVLGPATALLIGLVTSQTSDLSEVGTAMICGGLLIFLLSYTRLMSYLQRVFTSRVIVVILALISVTMMPTILQLIFDGSDKGLFPLWFTLILTLGLLIASRFLKGIWKSTVVLWGMLIGSVCYNLLSGIRPSIPALSSLSGQSLLISHFHLNPGILLSFLFCYIALFINDIGSIQSVGTAINEKDLEKRSKKGLRITGLLNALSGAAGVVGPVDYSLSTGVIMSTGCASRYTMIPTGIALILCSLFPHAIGILTLIPRPVMGIIILYLMMTQLASSFQLMSQKDAAPDFDSCMVIAVPLMIAMIPVFMPASYVAAMPSLLRPLLANGFVVGIITVLIMEHIIYRKKDSGQ